MITVRGVRMDIDVREELADYMHMFLRSTDKGTHLNSCSPFRDDTRPSFYVYFEDTDTARAGYWGDHAADDSEFARGTFLKLLAFLRDESEDETFAYLNEIYGTDAPADINRFQLRPNRRVNITQSFTPFDTAEYDRIHRKRLERAYNYLQGRRIDVKILDAANIGQMGSAVAIPWYNGRGELVAIKYRSLRDKMFWYAEDGADVARELYGMDVIYREQPKRVYIVEAEIDALYIRSLGFHAVALGNKAMNRHRAELLRKAPFTELVIVPDNDEPGMYGGELIYRFMQSYKQLFVSMLPDGYKDINDVPPEMARELLMNPDAFSPLDSSIEK